MWRYRDLPIQRKITIIVMVGMISAMVVTVGNFISFDRDNVRKDLIEEMRVLARITAARSAVAVAFGDRSNAQENLRTLSLRSTVQHACIYDQKETLFAQYQRIKSPFGGCPARLNYARAHIDSANPKLLDVVEPIFRKGSRLGYVLVSSDLSPINERTKKWITTSSFVTIVALLFAFLMTRRMQHSVVNPIRDLATLMDKVRSTNDLSLRAKVQNRDEVGHLVESFNEMLEILERHNRDLETLYRGLVEKSAEAEATAASLEVRNQQIKDLFGSAAHDLRQPLQAMTIFIDTLRKRVTLPEQAEIVDKLKQANNNLSELFTEILNASRYEFDLLSAGSQSIQIAQLFTKLFDEFEAVAHEKGLKLRFHTADYTVTANGALLERIVRNLLSNAIRYTDRGGVLLGCRRRDHHLCIEIWDTGCGIAEAKQAQIFSKFVQVSDTDRHGGFGLGLAIVKQFVDSLDYQLDLKSTVGKGSVFRLTVPLAEEDRHNPKTSPDHPTKYEVPHAMSNEALEKLHQHREIHILLVDDDDDLRAALRLAISDWGFAVQDYPDIQSMLGSLRQGAPIPDLIISDYQLGNNSNGAQAIHALRQYTRRQIPGFILSASESDHVWQEIRDSGFHSLHKPVKPARLRALINHLLQF